MPRRIALPLHCAILPPQRNDERGVVSFELLWSLILLVVLLPGLTVYFTNLTRTTKYLSDTHQSTLINLKTFAALTSALSALERNRLECAATIVSGSSLALPSGGAHPLASLTGTSVPRVDSDILTVIDLAPSYRGKVSSLNSVGSSIDASVCGASKRPSPAPLKATSSTPWRALSRWREILPHRAQGATKCQAP